MARSGPPTRNEIVRREIEAIEAARGQLIPEDVVEEATSRTSPLHGYFEWNNRVAGHEYRLIQARDLIRSVKVEVVTPDDNYKVRQWHSASRAGHSSKVGYVSNEEVVSDPRYVAALERQMQRDLLALRRRYNHLLQFWQILTDTLGEPPARNRRRRKAG